MGTVDILYTRAAVTCQPDRETGNPTNRSKTHMSQKLICKISVNNVAYVLWSSGPFKSRRTAMTNIDKLK